MRVLLASALVLASCGSAAGTGESGLHGIVTLGPTQPVCRVGIPCEKRAAHVLLFFARGATTISTRTDGRGRYRVSLAPGTYSVRTSAGIGHVPQPARVRVVAGRSRIVDFGIDTGIR